MPILSRSIFIFLIFGSLTSCCYRMPEHDEFSLVPATNNPHYTREKANQTPGIGY